jgi:hypothetical protein
LKALALLYGAAILQQYSLTQLEKYEKREPTIAGRVWGDGWV